MKRLFIAIELPDTARQKLFKLKAQAENHSAAGRCRIKWIKPPNLHLTLKFLGDVNESLLSPLRETLKDTCKKLSPFKMQISGCGAFSSRGAVRIIWAGVEKSAALSLCAAEIEDCCCALGFKAEKRAFKPHITLARVKSDSSGGGLLKTAEALPLEPIQLNIQSAVLMESVTKPSGAIYSIMERLPFKR